ncbi:hypothetical protein [Curtobacterium sp. VKM Ac-1376]|uniref:hypothetical protein n=1 Tax=Curtobacterium sp. VKM Ac-1376 TaxID=123312 RepID=UPI00188BE32A|nr:hypothetical protein [Curtobacterium sp. VKM Ac-1376]MBF4614998.1 hypothetical protein [Curtobacterium sp. VKM Ac-1376]
MTLAVTVWGLGSLLFLAAAAVSVVRRLPLLVRAVPSVVLVVALLLAQTLQLVPSPPGLPLGTLGIVAVCIVAVLAGSAVTGVVLGLAMRDDVERGQHGGILVANVDEPVPERPRPEVLRGGAVIGFLERFAIVGAALVGHLEIVAAVIAIKGLGRFTELDSAAARERFIVGTLTSTCWAGLATVAAIALR